MPRPTDAQKAANAVHQQAEDEALTPPGMEPRRPFENDGGFYGRAAREWKALYMSRAAQFSSDPLDQPLTLAEVHALLWAVRNLSHDSLKAGTPYGPREGVTGHGDLSTATNKIERLGSRLIDTEPRS